MRVRPPICLLNWQLQINARLKPCSPGPATLLNHWRGTECQWLDFGWTRHHAGTATADAWQCCFEQHHVCSTSTITIDLSVHRKVSIRLRPVDEPPRSVISIESVCQNDSTAISPTPKCGELCLACSWYCKADWPSHCAVKVLNPSTDCFILCRAMYLPALLPSPGQVSRAQSSRFD